MNKDPEKASCEQKGCKVRSPSIIMHGHSVALVNNCAIINGQCELESLLPTEMVGDTKWLE